MRLSKTQRDSVHSQGKRRLLYLYYRLLNCGLSKTEHQAICTTEENIPTTNIHTHIDFNHLDLESTFDKQEIVETR